MWKALKKLRLMSVLNAAQRMHRHRENNAVSDELLQREIGLYVRAAQLSDDLVSYKKFSFAGEHAVECLRAAAALGDMVSSRRLGERLLNQGKFWLNLTQSALANPYQEELAQECFRQAKVYLEFANEHDDPRAKRALGVIYVNGHGVPMDMDNGLKLITDSITLEDAWDRSSAIFKELKLDGPEFFDKLMKMKRSDS